MYLCYFYTDAGFARHLNHSETILRCAAFGPLAALSTQTKRSRVALAIGSSRPHTEQDYDTVGVERAPLDSHLDE